MKPGTRFKIECVVDDYGSVKSQVDGGRVGYNGYTDEEMFRAVAVDVVEPRERFTLPCGTVVERLRAGDTVDRGDLCALGDGRMARAHATPFTLKDGYFCYYRRVGE